MQRRRPASAGSTLQLGAVGSSQLPAPTGFRLGAAFAFWEGRALTKSDFDEIYERLRLRYPA
jgi:hypothetical protein